LSSRLLTAKRMLMATLWLLLQTLMLKKFTRKKPRLKNLPRKKLRLAHLRRMCLHQRWLWRWKCETMTGICPPKSEDLLHQRNDKYSPDVHPGCTKDDCKLKNLHCPEYMCIQDLHGSCTPPVIPCSTTAGTRH